MARRVGSAGGGEEGEARAELELPLVAHHGGEEGAGRGRER